MKKIKVYNVVPNLDCFSFDVFQIQWSIHPRTTHPGLGLSNPAHTPNLVYEQGCLPNPVCGWSLAVLTIEFRTQQRKENETNQKKMKSLK